MPLARARCSACTLPLGDPPFTPVQARCARCGTLIWINVGADGQPDGFDAAFPPAKLLAWFGAARLAMAYGTPGVAIGACTRCQSPVAVSSKQVLTLPCPHCREPVSGPAGDVLVDQWPEPWTKVEGAGIDLEYRLALIDDTTGVTAGCAQCATPTPANDPATRCARCGAVTWVLRHDNLPQTHDEPTRRVQLGVRINGTRGGRPFKVLVPIVQGEAMLRGDAALGAGDASGKSCMSASAIGCAVVVALLVVLSLAIGYCTMK